MQTMLEGVDYESTSFAGSDIPNMNPMKWSIALEEYKKQSGDPSGDLNKVNEFFNWTKENLEELYFKFMEKGREKGNR